MKLLLAEKRDDGPQEPGHRPVEEGGGIVQGVLRDEVLEGGDEDVGYEVPERDQGQVDLKLAR